MDAKPKLCHLAPMRLVTEDKPGSRLGDFLQNGFNSEATSFRGAVAFLRTSGMAHLKPLISKFSSNRPFQLIVGVDLKGTTSEGLNMLKDSLMSHGQAFVFYNNGSSTFHPKIFCFRYPQRAELYIGSGNFTAGGLFTNHEAGLVLSVDQHGPGSALLNQVDDAFDRWSVNAGASARLLDQDLIDELMQRGLVVTEAQARAAISKDQATKGSNTSAGTPGAPLFGTIPVPPAPPPLVNTSTASAAPESPSGSKAGQALTAAPTATKVGATATGNPVFWIETKSMTGGSRNILDLSMRSIVSKGDARGTHFDIGEAGFMKGSVAFFGVDPNNAKSSKDITLVFEGIEYTGNSLLFPVGSNANGTWRLQIKGINPIGQKITDAFRGKGQDHYLVQKIAVFENLGNDRYTLSVRDVSDLTRLQSISTILAFNGASKTAKRIGFI